jgi:hypothetical protein
MYRIILLMDWCDMQPAEAASEAAKMSCKDRQCLCCCKVGICTERRMQASKAGETFPSCLPHCATQCCLLCDRRLQVGNQLPQSKCLSWPIGLASPHQAAAAALCYTVWSCNPTRPSSAKAQLGAGERHETYIKTLVMSGEHCWQHDKQYWCNGRWH